MNIKSGPFPLLLDGATGTVLQSKGMGRGQCTEQWALEHPDVILELLRAYASAGSRLVMAPTFGLNRVNLEKYQLQDKIVPMAKELVALSKRAVTGYDVLVGGDISPLGLFLPPLGESRFGELVEIYKEQVSALLLAGVDFFMLETFMTMHEVRAAILAVKESCSLPLLVSMTFDKEGKTIMGTELLAALVTVQSMGADAFGLNCSTGPDDMLKLLPAVMPYARIPILVKPNMGLPETGADGSPLFSLSPHEFARFGKEFLKLGVSIIGGCCGTDARHIAALKGIIEKEGLTPAAVEPFFDPDAILASSERSVFFLDAAVDISRPIPCSDDMSGQIIEAEDHPYSVIKVSLSHPDDLLLLENNLYMINLPLCVETDDPALLEEAARIYNGRLIFDHTYAMEGEVLSHLSKKYGLIAL